MNPIKANGATGCKTDTAFNNQALRAKMAWIFTDPSCSRLSQGSVIHDLVSTPLVAEALALRSAILSSVNLEITNLAILSDNSTLIRAITGDIQSKEIIGIISDIRSISSGFASIVFSHFSGSKNMVADNLAKRPFRTFLLLHCCKLIELGHRFGSSSIFS